MVCHFFHRDFERCKILDKHLAILARKYFDTRFIKLSAPVRPRTQLWPLLEVAWHQALWAELIKLPAVGACLLTCGFKIPDGDLCFRDS